MAPRCEWSCVPAHGLKHTPCVRCPLSSRNALLQDLRSVARDPTTRTQKECLRIPQGALGESYWWPTDPEIFNFQLKKLINQTASELDSVGLGPSLLRSLHERGNPGHDLAHSEEQGALPVDSEGVSHASYKHAIVYEIALNSSVPEPRLRLSSRDPSDVGTYHSSTPTIQPIHRVDLLIPEQFLGRIRRALLHPMICIADRRRPVTVSQI